MRMQPIMDITNEPIEPSYKLQKEQVRQAITQAAKKRGWIVTNKTPHELAAKLYVRSHHAEIQIPYSEKDYSILYVKSINLKEKKGRIHRNYNRWIRNLNIDIQRQLGAMTGQ